MEQMGFNPPFNASIHPCFTAIARRKSEVPSFAKLEAEQQQIILRALKAQRAKDGESSQT